MIVVVVFWLSMIATCVNSYSAVCRFPQTGPLHAVDYWVAFYAHQVQAILVYETAVAMLKLTNLEECSLLCGSFGDNSNCKEIYLHVQAQLTNGRYVKRLDNKNIVYIYVQPNAASGAPTDFWSRPSVPMSCPPPTKDSIAPPLPRTVIRDTVTFNMCDFVDLNGDQLQDYVCALRHEQNGIAVTWSCVYENAGTHWLLRT
jgi:hypothetical protein